MLLPLVFSELTVQSTVFKFSPLGFEKAMNGRVSVFSSIHPKLITFCNCHLYLLICLRCKQRFLFVPRIFSSFRPSFLCLKPLMLSVVNGLASRFKAAIAECTFWLLRFIYTGILKLIVHISSRHGMTQCKQKVEIIKADCESCVLPIWVFCNFFWQICGIKIKLSYTTWKLDF